MYKVLIPQDIHSKAKDYLLQKGYNVQVGPGFDEQTLLHEVPDANALIVRTAPYPANVIQAATKLQIIARHGVGVDNIDLEQAKAQNIWVTVAKGANVTSVAEHTIALLLASAKQLKAFDTATRNDQFPIRNQLHGIELFGKTLGIIGLGAIGQKVAEIAAKGLGMKILAYDVFKPQNIPDYVSWQADVESIFKAADAISVHVPLTSETANLINRASIAMMKDGVILVNCARGGIFNEADLVEALKSGKVRAAGLDVFEQEPPQANHPLFSLNTVMMTPHNAALTDDAAEAMAMSCAIAVDDVLSGRKPQFPIVTPV